METIDKLKTKIKEQKKILELIKCNLRETEIIGEEVENTPYREEIINFYLDQFLEVTRNLEKLKNKLEILRKEYQLFPEKWKLKNKFYEKRNKKRNR